MLTLAQFQYEDMQLEVFTVLSGLMRIPPNRYSILFYRDSVVVHAKRCYMTCTNLGYL